MRPPRILLSLAVALPLLLSACGGNSSAAPTPRGPNEVIAADFAFTPATVTVTAGTTVTWRFEQPDAPHNVVALTDPVAFNSGSPKAKGTFAFTFTKPGTYPYLCQIHPSMKGTVVVTP